MKAFVEILSGVVRVGPNAEKFNDPYEFAAAFSADGDVATVKALVSPDKTTTFTPRHYAAGVKALKALGLRVKWTHRKSHD